MTLKVNHTDRWYRCRWDNFFSDPTAKLFVELGAHNKVIKSYIPLLAYKRSQINLSTNLVWI